MADEKKISKANADQIKKFISENKKKFEKSKKEDDVKKTKDSDYAKKSMKTDLFVQGRSPEKFPGFDQADRIRGGLKKGGRVKKRNTRRMNRLEELGRVDAEKAFTKKGKKNLKAEKKRIVRELKSSGGSAGAAIRGKGCEIR
tara:strand:+ start:47 stop:475 length:429 start_codon:yes stop_codon:yes gene_type:complete